MAGVRRANLDGYLQCPHGMGRRDKFLTGAANKKSPGAIFDVAPATAHRVTAGDGWAQQIDEFRLRATVN